MPEGFLFLNAEATRAFLEEGQNIPSGAELGAIFRPPDGEDSEDYWFAVFTYQDTGHVDDSDRDELDADGLMRSLKESNKLGNEERRRRGWGELQLVGWQIPPYYDQATNNLTWATELSAAEGTTINHSVRLLGRIGVISAQLVADPEQLQTATAEFDDVLLGFSFLPGQRYAEFRSGDKVAGYGLAALVGAGAAGVAIKTSVLQKFWKAIVLGLVALAASLKRFARRLFGRAEESTAPETADTGAAQD